MISDKVRQRLRQAQNIVVFTGAGMSVESGIPTFRDRFEGLWSKYDPMDVATPSAFKANPQFVWDWHVYLAETVRKARPNAGHRAVAHLSDAVKKVSVVTQNIDNLHQVAGSQHVLELHGNLFNLRSSVDDKDAFSGDRSPIICHVCDGYAAPEKISDYASKEDLAAIQLVAGPVPQCPSCEALLRPAIVWFGEMLEQHILEGAMTAIDDCDALICIGSSLEVQPASGLPYRALGRGSLVIEVNPNPMSLLSRIADATIVGTATTVMPSLLEDVWGIPQI